MNWTQMSPSSRAILLKCVRNFPAIIRAPSSPYLLIFHPCMHWPQLLDLTIIPTDHSSQICGHSSPEWLWSLHSYVLGHALLWSWGGSNVGVTQWNCTAWSSWDCKTFCDFWGSGSHPFGALFLNIWETYRKISGWFSSILAPLKLRRQQKG